MLNWQVGRLPVVLFAYAKDEEPAAEIEDTFALQISIIATDILKREIDIVMVFTKQKCNQRPRVYVHSDGDVA